MGGKKTLSFIFKKKKSILIWFIEDKTFGQINLLSIND